MNKSKITSGVRKILDLTVGNLGFGLGFGSAYAAEVPVLGVPFASLNQGVASGYNAAQVRIIASKIASGKTSVEDEMAKLTAEQRADLSTHVGRATGKISGGERIDPNTGEISRDPGFSPA